MIARRNDASHEEILAANGEAIAKHVSEKQKPLLTRMAELEARVPQLVAEIDGVRAGHEESMKAEILRLLSLKEKHETDQLSLEREILELRKEIAPLKAP